MDIQAHIYTYIYTYTCMYVCYHTECKGAKELSAVVNSSSIH